MTSYTEDPNDVPSSTMSYVTESAGPVYERFNFQPIKGRLYGYFVYSGRIVCRLERVDASVQAGADHLDNVLIVFIARRPQEFGGGQTVVGWYRDATLYPQYKGASHDPRFRDREDWDYCCECIESNAILLPAPERNWNVPHTKGGMGTTKIRYFDPRQPWMTDILDRIDAYLPSSIRENPDTEIEDMAAAAIETKLAQRQGYQLDSQLRRKIENYAISIAKRAYEKDGYHVDVCGRPYDLHCRKKRGSPDEIWVEVKGTQENPLGVILTYGEVEFYQSHDPHTELFVVHSIVVKNGSASGGKSKRFPRWKIESSSLQPLAYRYRIP